MSTLALGSPKLVAVSIAAKRVSWVCISYRTIDQVGGFYFMPVSNSLVSAIAAILLISEIPLQ